MCSYSFVSGPPSGEPKAAKDASGPSTLQVGNGHTATSKASTPRTTFDKLDRDQSRPLLIEKVHFHAQAPPSIPLPAFDCRFPSPIHHLCIV
ncbi:unnamed protein product [Heligmosomoides polygyrus]|uniref:Uncharacterized protein n=1 Tax=Heligmosomoides polygyrus TaxID=6339 RepID=A0A3P8FI66_HELPZ|nr:unnamed protein product [Heligmosomoides polygyrus]